MSDVRRISTDEQTSREVVQPAQRQPRSMEEIADSVEGIKQELTLMAAQLINLIKAVSQLSQRIAGRR